MMKREADEEPEGATPAKKRAIDGSEDSVKSQFREGLFSQLDEHRKQYTDSQPYRHGVISELLSDSLLRKVRSEILGNISFTLKETDIYRIEQSGDLANLDGLDEDALKRLPSLKVLRDALYSYEFREYLSEITGSGPLSGSKTDMAVNLYKPGCHLLCHDDVIGTRRVSYILYLTDPDQPWEKGWGGALRLYPTADHKDEKGQIFKVPEASSSVSIPPAFNQLSFFAVQPGESFHDVEEVYAPDDQGGESNERLRMAISGWYHIPQRGENGYKEGLEQELAEKSSLTQLQGTAEQFDLPVTKAISYKDAPVDVVEDDETTFSPEELDFLLQFINPQYLTPMALSAAVDIFVEQCLLEMPNFLSKSFSEDVRQYVEMKEAEAALLLPKESSTAETWSEAIPPHKHRFLYTQSSSAKETPTTSPFQRLLGDLIPSQPFRKWLQQATGTVVRSHSALARRFRRGNDYTLAQRYDKDNPGLEICLSLTPVASTGSISAATNEEVSTAAANEDVSTATANEEVSTATANEEVRTATANEEVSTATASEEVSTAAASEEISTAAANEEVSTVPANEEDRISHQDTQQPHEVKNETQGHQQGQSKEKGSDADAVPVNTTTTPDADSPSYISGPSQTRDQSTPPTQISVNDPDSQTQKSEGKEPEPKPLPESSLETESALPISGTEEVSQDLGGYLAYMAADEDNDDDHHHDETTADSTVKPSKAKHDPAVYQSSSSKRVTNSQGAGDADTDDIEDEDDPILFHMPPVWNQLGIVLRDKGTMRFVKYLSRQAKRDRWDVSGEFEVDGFGEDDEEEDAGEHDEGATRGAIGVGVEEEETEVEAFGSSEDETESDI